MKKRYIFGINNSKGFSLVELMVTFAILAILSVAVVGFVNAGSTSFRGTNNDATVQSEAQITMNLISDLVIDTTKGITYTYATTEGGTEVVSIGDTPGAVEKKLRVYNNEEAIEIMWKESTHKLYYSKYAIVSGALGPKIAGYEEVLMSEYVDSFDANLGLLTAKRIIQFTLKFDKGGKIYTGQNNVTIRNKIEINKTIDELYHDEEVAAGIPSEIKISGTDNYYFTNSEEDTVQLTYNAEVTGEGAVPPSQIVDWYVKDTKIATGVSGIVTIKRAEIGDGVFPILAKKDYTVEEAGKTVTKTVVSNTITLKVKSLSGVYINYVGVMKDKTKNDLTTTNISDNSKIYKGDYVVVEVAVEGTNLEDSDRNITWSLNKCKKVTEIAPYLVNTSTGHDNLYRYAFEVTGTGDDDDNTFSIQAISEKETDIKSSVVTKSISKEAYMVNSIKVSASDTKTGVYSEGAEAKRIGYVKAKAQILDSNNNVISGKDIKITEWSFRIYALDEAGNTLWEKDAVSERIIEDLSTDDSSVTFKISSSLAWAYNFRLEVKPVAATGAEIKENIQAGKASISRVKVLYKNSKVGTALETLSNLYIACGGDLNLGYEVKGIVPASVDFKNNCTGTHWSTHDFDVENDRENRILKLTRTHNGTSHYCIDHSYKVLWKIKDDKGNVRSLEDVYGSNSYRLLVKVKEPNFKYKQGPNWNCDGYFYDHNNLDNSGVVEYDFITKIRHINGDFYEILKNDVVVAKYKWKNNRFEKQ